MEDDQPQKASKQGYIPSASKLFFQPDHFAGGLIHPQYPPLVPFQPSVRLKLD